VVIKLGGGLITEKKLEKSVRKQVLSNVCAIISKIVKSGFPVVLVHGAGSFGHPMAKKWNIVDGSKVEIIEEQRVVIGQIRKDMADLSSIVRRCLGENGIISESFPPSNWVTGIGADFRGDLSNFERKLEDPVPITFGDVVDIDTSIEFGILSGDDLMLRLSTEIPDVTHSIFLLGDSDGLMDRPPQEIDSKLIDNWNPKMRFEGKHDERFDVTGGIGLKLERAVFIASEVSDVWFINGNNPDRMVELLEKGTTIGTKIHSS